MQTATIQTATMLTATIHVVPEVGVQFLAFSFVVVTVCMAVLYGVWFVVSFFGGSSE